MVDATLPLHGFRREFVACSVLSTWLSLLALVPALTVGVILDRVVHTRATATLVVVLLAYLLFHLCELVFTALNDRLLLHLSQALTAREEDRFLERLVQLPFQSLEALQHALAQERYAAIGPDVRFLVDWRVGRLSQGLGLLVAAAALLLVHPALGGWILLLSLVYWGLLLAAQGRQRRMASELQALRDRMAHTAYEGFRGLPTLRAHGAWRPWSLRWQSERERVEKGVEALSGMVLRRFLGGLFYERLTLAIILGLGAWEALEGRLSIGQLVMLNLLFRQLAHQLRQLAQLMQRRVGFQASRRADHAFWEQLPLTEVSQTSVRQAGSAREAGTALSVRGLGYSSQEGRQILSGLAFELPAGATLALVGPSGAGKSTLLKILCGLYAPTQGHAYLLGRPCAQAQGQAYLSQKEFLFGGTVGDNVRLGRADLGADPEQLLGALELQSELATAASRLHASTPAAGLSGGERQRVFLARALSGSAGSLFLDEPTTALDMPRSRAVGNYLQSLTAEGRLLVFATHDRDLAALADYVLCLDGGRQLFFGPSAKVLATLEDSPWIHLGEPAPVA